MGVDGVNGSYGGSLAFAEEVEGFVDFFLCGCLVDADVADVGKESEVDGAGSVLLVVRHQFEESRVVVAGDGERAVVLLDKADALAHDGGRKSCLHATEIEFGNESPSHGIAVKHRTTC